jgi:hypothetical protein
VLEHEFDVSGRPAVIFVMFFANDVDADYDGVVNGLLADRERRWQDSLGQLRRMKQFASTHGVTPVLAAIPPAEQVLSHASQEYYQRVLGEFAGREGIPLVNLIAPLSSADAPSFYWDWDPHFTPRGHRVVADALYAETAHLFK